MNAVFGFVTRWVLNRDSVSSKIKKEKGITVITVSVRKTSHPFVYKSGNLNKLCTII